MSKQQEYWDKNIEAWGEYYLEMSHGHEKFDRPSWFSYAYANTIGQIERRLMKQRYDITIDFLRKSISPGTRFTDLGCGTGVFTVAAAQQGAIVTAVDFSESSISATRKAVERHVPDAMITYVQSDVQNYTPPTSDVTLAMGLTPYLNNIEIFIENVLPSTKSLFCHYIDPYHWASRVRSAIPYLDVRDLNAFSKSQVSAVYSRLDRKLAERTNFASGYIDLVK